MSLLLAGVGVLLLTVPLLAVQGQLFSPAQVRISCVAIVGGALLIGAGSAVAAVPLLVWVHDGREVSQHLFSRVSPGGPFAWLLGTIVVGAGGYWLGSSVCGARRARKRAALPRWAAVAFEVDGVPDVEIRVAPTREPIAFAVPGRDCHVVVSQLVTDLPEEQRRAVIAHERAHLLLRHDRHLLVLSLYERLWGWLPGARAVVSCHRTSIERWADDEALRDEALTSTSLYRARRNLLGYEHAKDSEHSAPPAVQSVFHLTGIVIVVGVLLSGGLLSASYSVTEIATVFAGLH